MSVNKVGIDVKQMAELLKGGASMLSETCPQCGTPLFRKGKDTFCAKCNRPVVILKSSEDEGRLVAKQILENVEQTLLVKMRDINSALKTESDPDKLVAYGNALNAWLGAIERLRVLKTQNAD
jgi:UPF0148 protein